jgi:uncharacterized protein YjbI with pentapeptide repeats
VSRDSLLEYEHRFIELKSDLRPHRKYVASQWYKRDDKAATGIKFRIALAISRGSFEDKTETKFEPCSINQAEKIASGTDVYKEFLDQRSFYRESFINISDLRNDIDSYINLIKDILKSI